MFLLKWAGPLFLRLWLKLGEFFYLLGSEKFRSNETEQAVENENEDNNYPASDEKVLWDESLVFLPQRIFCDGSSVRGLFTNLLFLSLAKSF